MITLGLILLLIGWLASIGTLEGIGVILIVIGLVANLVGGSGGKRYY